MSRSVLNARPSFRGDRNSRADALELRRRTREYNCLSLRPRWEGCVLFVLKFGGGLAKVGLQWLTLQIPIGCGRRP